MPSAFVLSQAEIENELRKHGSGFAGGKQRIMALYQTQPDRKLRAKALAKEYGIGGHSQDFLDGSSGFVNHDGKGLEFDHYPDHQKVTLSWTQVEKYIDLMIQSDRYLTDKEKEHRAAVQEAERQLPMLDGDAAAEYNALKEQYPNTLIGFELGGYFLFYDKDAITVKEVFRSNLLSQENALGKVKVTGFLRREWVAKSQKLWAEGNSIYLAGQGGDGTHHQTKYLREEDYLPIGIIIKLDGRDFRVDHVNFMFKSVSLQDMDLTNSGQPIFRVERLPNIRELYEQQQDEFLTFLLKRLLITRSVTKLLLTFPPEPSKAKSAMLAKPMCASTPARMGSRGITRYSTSSNSRTVCGGMNLHLMRNWTSCLSLWRSMASGRPFRMLLPQTKP